MILLLTTATCKKESSETSESLDSFATANFSFLKSTQASNDANQLRGPVYSAIFEILKVDRNKEAIQITLSYPVGCGDSKFEIIWNGLTTLPPSTIIIYLRRTTDCTVAGNSTSRILSINLADCLGDETLAQRVNIILCNPSKKANTENSDISITSK